MEKNTPLRKCPSRSKAEPIAIPNKKPSTEEYSLKQDVFDPNKSSPPNSWNNRLRTRIGYDSTPTLKNYLSNKP